MKIGHIFFIALSILSTSAFASGFHISPQVVTYHGNKISNSQPLEINQETSVQNSIWECKMVNSQTTRGNKCKDYLFILKKGIINNGGVRLAITCDDWSTKHYLILPGAAYWGNRFEYRTYHYEPLFHPEDYKIEQDPIITNVPKLNIHNGDSEMELTTGDLTTPSIGVWSPKNQRGYWLLMNQGNQYGNYSLDLIENSSRDKLTCYIASPGVRKIKYTMTNLSKTNETGVQIKEGDTLRISIAEFNQKCHSPSELNNQFLYIRKTFGITQTNYQIPFSAAFDMIEKDYNEKRWDSDHNYYALGSQKDFCTDWQLGWVGGLIATHALGASQYLVSQKRSFKNFDEIINNSQASSGFYYGCAHNGEWCSDCFHQKHPDNLALIRRDGDALYFIYKYCNLQKARNQSWTLPISWEKHLKLLQNAIVKLWDKNHQFGQFIDIENGNIKVGGSSSSAMLIGGLALAYQSTQNKEYLRVAEESGEFYYKNYVVNGLSNGGPGEIMQTPDSESAFAMLESYVALYEVTSNKHWLNYAEDAASLCATWVVSYDYHFPEKALFGKLGMKTTGAVWANVQNKHAAPGICTLSGDALLKLYEATNNKVYLELIQDISSHINQYLSRKDRMISSLPEGWINERVNLSDWEGKSNVGNVFYGTTWADVSSMLIAKEIPSIYIDNQRNIYCFDQLICKRLDKNHIQITNPTLFDCKMSVYTDNTKDIPSNYLDKSSIYDIKSHQSLTLSIR